VQINLKLICSRTPARRSSHYLSWRRAGNRLIASLNPISARLWRRPCGVAWDAVPEPMVEYIVPDFKFIFVLPLSRVSAAECIQQAGFSSTGVCWA
jgi:hypothetical protein